MKTISYKYITVPSGRKDNNNNNKNNNENKYFILGWLSV